MSLDVYLKIPGRGGPPGSGIWVREGGETKEITHEEWDAKFPGREPVIYGGGPKESPYVYQRNITHNMARMAEAAGIYQYLWRPDEIGVTKAAQLIEPLQAGLDRLTAEPAKYKEFNPSNGWGSYEGLTAFVASYLAACREYPEAEVEVSR